MANERKEQSAFSAAKWMTGSSYVIFLTGFINSVFITRALGPESYGVYSYLVWMVTFSLQVTTGGLNITAIRFIAEAIGQQDLVRAHAIHLWLRRLLWIGMGLMGCALLATTLAPGMFPTEVSARLGVYLVFVILCMVTKAIYMFEMSASKGYSVFYTEAITSGGVGLATTVLSSVLFALGQGLDAYLLLFLVTTAVQPVLARLIMNRSGVRPQPGGELDPEARSKLSHALKWNSGLALVGMVSSKSVDTYLMGLQSLTVYIGYYNIAAALAKSGLDLLSTGFSAMLLPFISRAQAEGGHAKVQEMFAASVRFYQFAGILVAVGGYLMGEVIVTLLYGRAYAEVIPALQVMALVGGLTLPGASYSAVFIATDNHQARLRFIFVGAGISLVAAFVFIPWLGFHGALLSAIVGNGLSFLVIAVVAHRSLNIRFPVRNIVVMAACAGAALGLVSLFHDPSSLLLSLAATFGFGVVFLVLSLNSRAWEPDDIVMLKKNSRHLEALLGRLQWRKAA